MRSISDIKRSSTAQSTTIPPNNPVFYIPDRSASRLVLHLTTALSPASPHPELPQPKTLNPSISLRTTTKTEIPYIMASREAAHAGSWYSGSARALTRELDAWLAQVPESLDKVGSLPVPGARVIIAPYVYSPAKAILLERTEGLMKQTCWVFLLGTLCSLRIQGS
jgi:hypothetical protein